MSKHWLVASYVSVALAWNGVWQLQAQTLPAPDEKDTAAVTVNLFEPPPKAAPAAPARPAAAPQCPAPPMFPAPAPPAPGAPPAAPIFAEAAPAGTEVGGGAFNPQMLGDSLSAVSGALPVGTFVVLPGSTFALNRNILPNLQTQFAGNVPVPFSISGFKIADNEGPRPEDRIFFTFNYFTHVFHNVPAPGSVLTGVTQIVGEPPTPIITPLPQALGLARTPDSRVGREMVGFEKTFFGGDASIGMRIPFIQIHNEEAAAFDDVGDVSFVTKFALLNDPNRVFSVGLVLTVPSGPGFATLPLFNTAAFTNNFALVPVTVSQNINPTIVQPYLAYLWRADRFYVHGFSSIAFFTTDSVSPEWFNDIGVGWYAYQGTGSVASVVPTAELHLTTPFGHQGSLGFPVGQIDTLVATIGTHFLFQKNAVFTIGVEFPLTGPEPFSTEWVAQFNLHF
jgi:hypothetical protein